LEAQKGFWVPTCWCVHPHTNFELVGGANGLLVEFAIVFQNQNLKK